MRKSWLAVILVALLSGLAIGAAISPQSGTGTLTVTLAIDATGRITRADYAAALPGRMPVRWDGLAENRFVVLSAGNHSNAEITAFLRCMALQECDEAAGTHQP